MEDRILRKPKVRDITGLSSTQIDRMEYEDRFPRRRQISERITGWSYNEVQAWIHERLHGSAEQK
jgi:predicted DNA-binding transcriptional regulator AlpA